MKCTINDIANVISESIPNPAESGYDIFVGLEHYDSGEVKITRYGSTDSLVTAVKVFKKGDILLARRNVYLKRAGLVDFDGVTSGDSIVLRVKPDLSKLGTSSSSVQKYLPFVLNTEEFWNYAEKYSDGTMSKRLSPKTLLQYEFEIPDDVDNRNDLLWSAFETKESYRTMIKAIDEMVKSQFIEMFGDPRINPLGWAISSFGKEFEIASGGTPDTKNDAYWGGDISWIGSNLCQNTILENNDGKYITQEGLNSSSAKLFKPNYVLVALVGATIGKCAILTFDTTTNQNIAGINVPGNNNYTSEFVFFVIQGLYNEFMLLGDGHFRMASLGFIRGLPLISPPISLQESFSIIVHQADKSKFDGFKSQFIELVQRCNPEKKTLESICTRGPQNGFYRKGAEIDGTIPIVKMSQLFGFESMSDVSHFDLVSMTEDEIRRFSLTENDLLFGRRSLVPEGAGKCRRAGIIDKTVVFESSILRVSIDPAICYPRFIQAWTESPEGEQAISELRAGTSVVGITGSGLSKVIIPVPTKSVQDVFIGVAEQADKSKYLN